MSPDRLVSQIAEIPPLQEFREPTVKTPDTLKPPGFSLRQKLADVLNAPNRKEYRVRRGSGRSRERCFRCGQRRHVSSFGKIGFNFNNECSPNKYYKSIKLDRL